MKEPFWLCVTNERLPYDEIRAFWNARDSMVDDVSDRPSFCLGPSLEPVLDGDPRAPADRVHTLLFLRGTLPDYRLPVIDNDLTIELLSACAAHPGDPVPSVDLPSFTKFLDKYRGWQCFA